MKRVIYKKNPLVEVIIQLRFPSILSINANEPAEFQEAIRQKFPIYQVGIEQEQEISIVAKEDAFFPSIRQQNKQKNHMFITADGQYKINLTSSFISISTLNYTRWEVMMEHFEDVVNSFFDIYKPSFFERIGLRYIDAFSKEKLEIKEKSWKDLIKTTWIGPLAALPEESMIVNNVDVEYILDDSVSRAKIHTGLGTINNDSENVFIIDSDFIKISTIEISEYKDVLDYLHSKSGEFLRNAITDTLHNAMEPEVIE